jgi:hypothetical protein
MEEQRDEFDDPGYRLMMDIYTRQMGDMSKPSRWWIGLGIVLVVLGAGAWLLLGTGNYTHETSDARGTVASTSRDPASQRQTNGLPERAHLLVPSSLSQAEPLLLDHRDEQSRAAVMRPSSGSQAGRGTRGLSTAPAAPRHPKASSPRPTLVSKPTQGAGCREKDCLQRVARQESVQFWQRSLRDEFDPNAARVLSTD